jgi:hypothetical protein
MRVISAAAVVCLVVAAGGVAQVRVFTPDDLPKIVRVGDPQISPDGKTIAMVVGRANLKDDRWDSELDLVDVATKDIRAVTHGRMGGGFTALVGDGGQAGIFGGGCGQEGADLCAADERR